MPKFVLANPSFPGEMVIKADTRRGDHPESMQLGDACPVAFEGLDVGTNAGLGDAQRIRFCWSVPLIRRHLGDASENHSFPG